MPKFVKKLIVVEAAQWFPGLTVPGVCDDHLPWPAPRKLCGCVLVGGVNSGVPHVHPTRADHGVRIEPGDWIIREQDGSGFYPCKPDVFTATYDPAPDFQ